MNRYPSERRPSGTLVGPSGEPTIVRIPRSQLGDPRDRDTDRGHRGRPHRSRRPRSYSTGSEEPSSDGTRRPSSRRRRPSRTRRPHPDDRHAPRRSIADSPLATRRSLSYSDGEYEPQRPPPARLVSRSPTHILSRAQSSIRSAPLSMSRTPSPGLPPVRVESPSDFSYSIAQPPHDRHITPPEAEDVVPSSRARSQATRRPSQRETSQGKQSSALGNS